VSSLGEFLRIARNIESKNGKKADSLFNMPELCANPAVAKVSVITTQENNRLIIVTSLNWG
jgi:hypothetical protein